MMEARNRARIARIKLQAGCAECGFAGHPAALQFDNQPGTVKVGNISEMTRRSWAVIAAEIANTEVVCANHHAIRTWTRAVTS